MKRTLTLLLFSLLMLLVSPPAASTSGEVYVCMSNGAVAYHLYENCKGLNRCSRTIKKMSVSQAQSRGLRKCKICY